MPKYLIIISVVGNTVILFVLERLIKRFICLLQCKKLNKETVLLCTVKYRNDKLKVIVGNPPFEFANKDSRVIFNEKQESPISSGRMISRELVQF